MSEETNIEQLVAAEEAIDYKDKYLRLLADVENSRKRMQKEKQDMVRFGIENISREILGPMDNLENALKHAENLSGELKNWAHGISDDPGAVSRCPQRRRRGIFSCRKDTFDRIDTKPSKWKRPMRSVEEG